MHRGLQRVPRPGRLVSLVLVVGLIYVSYRHPALALLLTVGLAGIGVLAAVVFGIVQAGVR